MVFVTGIDTFSGILAFRQIYNHNPLLAGNSFPGFFRGNPVLVFHFFKLRDRNLDELAFRGHDRSCFLI